MPRLRPRTSFAAAFVVVAACGGGAGDPVIDAGDWSGTENPPGYDREPGPPCHAASDSAVGCNECFVRGFPFYGDPVSVCTNDICEVDDECCDTAWDERCVDLADLLCPDARCAGDVAFGGEGELTLGTASGGGFEPASMTATDASPIRSTAWADFDGDGDADVAVATDCGVRIERNDGWLSTLTHDVVFQRTPVPDCANLPEDQRWGGRRVRWADVDEDLDLDLVVAGRAGVRVIEQEGGGFSDGTIVMSAARGAATDIALANVDQAGIDVIVSIAGVGTRVFRLTWDQQDGYAWVEDETWTGVEATSMELCDIASLGERELVVAGDVLVAYDMRDPGVGAPMFAPVEAAGTLVTCVITEPGLPDLIATASPGASPVRIYDGGGGLRWSSVDDLEPDVTIDARGIEAGRLRDDAPAVVVSSGAPDAGFHVFTLDAFPAFVHALVPDLVPDNDTTAVELVPLVKPPPR